MTLIPWPRRIRVRLILLTVVVLLLIIFGTERFLGALDRGPAQPIPFSHRIHVQTKELNCFFCHQFATRSSNAGMPPVNRCLLCHTVIASSFPPIAKIRWYYRRNEPIPWVRVGKVPDFVFFQHQPHLAMGFDCSRCHGNVRAMDRIKLVNKFDMNFCVTCHKQNGASVDCYMCHR